MNERLNKLGEILLEKNMIEHSQLMEALEAQRTDQRRLGEILTSHGLIDEADVARVLAGMYHIPFVNLSEKAIDRDVLAILSNDILQTYKVLPLAITDGKLTLATNDPLNVDTLQDIQYQCGLDIEPVMASLSEISCLLEEYQDSLQAVEDEKSHSRVDTEGRYILDLVDSVIRSAIREKASDIHIELLPESLRVRFRIDGVLYEKSPISRDVHRNIIARLKVMAGMDVTENRSPQDGRFHFTHNQKEYDIRISTLVNSYGENMVMRILGKDFQEMTFEDLGMEERESQTLRALIQKPHGLILVTGPTGAGKTTTLYSMLTSLNHSTKNIISIEDPVEYMIRGINQTVINKFTGYTFATSMKYILRHDPDIIMLGEIRDVETAEAAVRAALTGHLVLSTVHTNTASGAITRLLEMDIEPFLISSAVKGVVAQRLVRKLCRHCKEEVQPSAAVRENIQTYFPDMKEAPLYQAKGCAQCLHKGFSGREAVYEVLNVGENLKEMILRQKSDKELTEAAVNEGMRTLQVNGMRKVAAGITTWDEVLHTIAVE